ncbi:MAG: EI24 domain-containing protein [Haliscomenobacter sp.]|uniref:EI24 domain-containing protein n=1 Tax=Haliscomenobacter sp. TaxID=2717303 RepID=UPI0029B52E07|nr:EI24 domain-containing protein [Haliscomenobacter sp.]MDX2071414.1 EI24 domain-containing protein [Haliscomenobacter sp.]
MFTSFLAGVSAYGRALQLCFKYNLWIYFLVPALLSILLGGGMIYGIWNVSDNLGNWMAGFWPFSWGKGWVDNVAQVFGGLAVGAFAFIIFRNLVLALAGPFMSLLSERVENRLRGEVSATFKMSAFLSDMVRGIRIAIRLIVRELFFTTLLFLLGLIPGLAMVTTPLIFIVQAYYAGAGNIDFALERHYRVRDSIRFVRQNRGLAIGNGTVYLLLLLSVVGFLVALPLGTIAATVETVKRIK